MGPHCISKAGLEPLGVSDFLAPMSQASGTIAMYHTPDNDPPLRFFILVFICMMFCLHMCLRTMCTPGTCRDQ